MILKNCKKTIDKETFQPCIIGEFVISLELLADMKALNGEDYLINFIGKSFIEQLKNIEL